MRLIEDDILFEIADEIMSLRRTTTPEQREILWENAVKEYPENGRELPEYMQIMLDGKAVENIAYHREFWERAGSKYSNPH